MTESDRITTLSGFSRIIRIIEDLPVDDVADEIEAATLEIFRAASAARFIIRNERFATWRVDAVIAAMTRDDLPARPGGPLA